MKGKPTMLKYKISATSHTCKKEKNLKHRRTCSCFKNLPQLSRGAHSLHQGRSVVLARAAGASAFWFASLPYFQLPTTGETTTAAPIAANAEAAVTTGIIGTPPASHPIIITSRKVNWAVSLFVKLMDLEGLYSTPRAMLGFNWLIDWFFFCIPKRSISLSTGALRWMALPDSNLGVF